MVTMMARRRLHRRRCESQGERRNNTCSGPFVLHDVPPSIMLGELEEEPMSPGATSTKAILSLPQLFQLNGVDLAMKKCVQSAGHSWPVATSA